MWSYLHDSVSLSRFEAFLLYFLACLANVRAGWSLCAMRVGITDGMEQRGEHTCNTHTRTYIHIDISWAHCFFFLLSMQQQFQLTSLILYRFHHFHRCTYAGFSIIKNGYYTKKFMVFWRVFFFLLSCLHSLLLELCASHTHVDVDDAAHASEVFTLSFPEVSLYTQFVFFYAFSRTDFVLLCCAQRNK